MKRPAPVSLTDFQVALTSATERLLRLQEGLKTALIKGKPTADIRAQIASAEAEVAEIDRQRAADEAQQHIEADARVTVTLAEAVRRFQAALNASMAPLAVPPTSTSKDQPNV